MNPHDIATTGTRSLRVCQFRHSCTTFNYEILYVSSTKYTIHEIVEVVNTFLIKKTIYVRNTWTGIRKGYCVKSCIIWTKGRV